MMTDWFGDELHPEIEKFWRDKFSSEIESQVLRHTDCDQQAKWFNEGIRYASMYIRHKGEGAS